MGTFLRTFGAISILVSVMLGNAHASTSTSNSSAHVSQAADPRGLMVTLITANHLFYAGANGECTVKCDLHELAGVSQMGTVHLLMAERETWTKLVDENGPDYIHCQFTWTSHQKSIDYDLFTKNQGSIVPLMTMWTVTEVGLFQVTATGEYSMVMKWSAI